MWVKWSGTHGEGEPGRHAVMQCWLARWGPGQGLDQVSRWGPGQGLGQVSRWGPGQGLGQVSAAWTPTRISFCWITPFLAAATTGLTTCSHASAGTGGGYRPLGAAATTGLTT